MKQKFKFLLLIFCILISPVSLLADFDSGTPFGTGVYYSSIALGDIDNDGDLDLIVTGYDGSGRRLDKYINNGAGNFTGTSFGTGVNSSSIALGDIDNDGDLDLIVAGNDGSGRRLDKYINDGAGNFSGPTSFGTIVYQSSIALGDIDNDGDLDLIVTGEDNGSAPHRLDKYINDGAGNWTGPTPFGTGVYISSIALGDMDNDGDLDLIVTGDDNGSAPHRLDKYINLEATLNNPPSVPTGLFAQVVNGKWRLKWNKSTDDHTSQNMLRYQIAIGTNSGQYRYASTAIDYPRGQANLGKVTIVTGTPWYQTKITNTKCVYWRVCAIDSAFKYSAYSPEQQSCPPYSGPFYVDDNTGNDANPGTFSQPFRTIQRAVNRIAPGIDVTSATCYIFPGTYNEQVTIASNKNPGYMVFTKLSNISPLMNGFGSSNIAIKITNAKRVIIKGLTIKRYTSRGIYLTGTAESNRIIANQIYSNSSSGINFSGDGVRNNIITSNSIFGPGQSYGIYFNNSDKNYIQNNNRIYRNLQYGIYFDGTAGTNYISQNQIYSNNNYGIYINSETADNNFILTNHIFGTNHYFGIYINYADNNIISSNSIYNIKQHGIYFYSANSNKIINNRIYSCKEGGIRVNSSTNSKIFDNKIYSNYNNGIWLNNSRLISISNNRISHCCLNWGSGLQVLGTNTKDIYIKNNILYSNISESGSYYPGILIQGGTATNILIYSNEFYSLSVGIQNQGADFVKIEKNYLHNIQSWNAILIGFDGGGGTDFYANSNIVTNNSLLHKGINVSWGKGHKIINNLVRDINTNTPGITVYNVSNFLIKYNNVKKNRYGIQNNASFGDIIYNNVISNGNGIILSGKASGNVKFNSVTFNTDNGIIVWQDNGSFPAVKIRKNNFVLNNRNFSTGTNYDVRTNWWGSSVKGYIQSKFGYYGPPGSITINFEPYRLWRAFDLTEGADTESLPTVTGFTATVVNNTNVNLKWNKITNSDLAYYVVYRALTGNYGILEHKTNYILTITTNTNYTDEPDGGVYYYWVTAVDKPSPNTFWSNESWYSKMQSVTIGTGTNVHNITQNKWYWTIQSAINEANTGDTLLVYPYGYPVSGSKVYQESIEISTNTTSASYIKIIATNWQGLGVIDTVIDGSGNASAIKVLAKRRIEIHGFKIKNDTFNGIEIKEGSSGNIISHNIIYSNNNSWLGGGIPPIGILVHGSLCSNNSIASNQFYNNIVDSAILGGYNNSIFSNRFNSSFEGIGLADDSGVGAHKNIVKNNIIYNMSENGIGFHSLASNNTIISNTIYNCTNGIRFESQNNSLYSFNKILFNKIYNNKIGILAEDKGNNKVNGYDNLFGHNIITNNIETGIFVSSSNFNNNKVTSNFIKNNLDGISIESSSGWTIYSNQILNNTNGIYFENVFNMDIERNILKNNSSSAIFITNSTMLNFKFNTILSNDIGIEIYNSSADISKNNVYSNSWNFYFQNFTSLGNTDIWHGSTVWNNIKAKIGPSSPSWNNVAPWRLFGPLDIREGADTQSPPIVTGVRVEKSGTNAIVKWDSSLAPDLARYFIYRTTASQPTNLSFSDVKAIVPSGVTIWTDFGGAKSTNYYYYVTALDNYPIYTNESWYSEPAQFSTNVWNVTKNKYYSKIKDAILDADGGGIFNEIRVLVPQTYNEDNIELKNDQNIKIVSKEYLNYGTWTNTIINSTNQFVNYIFKVKGNAKLDIEGFTIKFAGTNEDWGSGNVSAAITFDGQTTSKVQHINFYAYPNAKIGIRGGGFNSTIIVQSNRFEGFRKSGSHINISGKFSANIFTNCSEGVTLDGGSANSLVSNNIFKNCNSGIMCWGNDNNERIVRNLIINCGYGISLFGSNGAHPSIINNTIAHCTANGIQIDTGFGSPVIKNNIIFSNGQYGINCLSGGGASSYNNVYGHSVSNWAGCISPGTGDISDNTPPIFIGGSPYDYHLADYSPSIAAGENSVDQGCYPYNCYLRILRGPNSKPTGSIPSTGNNNAMLQLHLKTERSASVTITAITFTNFGTSSLNPPLEIASAPPGVKLYYDVNNNGIVDGADGLPIASTNFGLNIYATFNLTLTPITIPGNSSTNLIISYDTLTAVPPETYFPIVIGAGVTAQESLGGPIKVYGTATGYTQTVAGGIHHFVIQHRTNEYYKVPAPITITAYDLNNTKIDFYSGTISIWVLNDTAEVFWTNGNGAGTLIDGGPGQDWAKYTFTPADNGDVMLYLTYYTQGVLNIETRDINITTATDNDIEGNIRFNPPPVWNVTLNKYYGKLSTAVSNASGFSNTIWIMTNLSDGNILISTNTTSCTQLYITSKAWQQSGNKSTRLNGAGYNFGIAVSGSNKRVKIEGFTIANASGSALKLMDNSTKNTVRNVVLISNNKYQVEGGGAGIFVLSDNNSVISNEIYYDAWGIGAVGSKNKIFNNIVKYCKAIWNPNDGGGIVIASMGSLITNNIVKNNIVISNVFGCALTFGGENIYKNLVYSNICKYNKNGILIDSAKNNEIYNNYVSHNSNNGLVISSVAFNNKIYNNQIYSNFDNGILINGYPKNSPLNNQIYGNICFTNENGIKISGASNTIISNNQFINNSLFGFFCTNAPGTKLILNTLKKNLYGVQFKYSPDFICSKNNIFSNIQYNGRSPEGGGPSTYANNWWGSTVWDIFKTKFEGTPPYSIFTNWRLFGEFNITQNADTKELPRVIGLTATTNGPQIQLKWNKVPNPDGDFVRYFIYRSTNSGFTNLSRANVIAQISPIDVTNYIDSPPSPGYWYYWITALDDPAPPTGSVYTNESWYSAYASAYIAPILSIIANNTNLYYTNINLNWTTASQESYISNNGNLNCKIIGQINDFTNYIYGIAWEVTNSASLEKDQVRVEIKTINGSIPNWYSIINSNEEFVVSNNLPVGGVVRLFIRVTTPPQTSSKGPYKSRIKLRAVEP